MIQGLFFHSEESLEMIRQIKLQFILSLELAEFIKNFSLL